MSELELDGKVTEFLINRDEEETNMTLDYAKQLLTLELEIKGIRDDMKAIKDDAKSEGVAVGKVTKAIKLLKDAIKADANDLLELENIEEVLGSNVDIKSMISELVKK